MGMCHTSHGVAASPQREQPAVTTSAEPATATVTTPALGRRPPIATYRLQLTADAGFVAAHDVLDHLVRLGVSHVYLSPVLQAVPGSPHGYDAIDPHHLDVDRGGEQAFAALVARSHELGLQVLLDVVPNHLASDPRNGAWADVLRHGRSSRFASWFDLSWGCGTVAIPDRLLLPILGRRLDDAIRAGDVAAVRHAGELQLRVYDQHLPLSDASVAELFVAVAATFAGTGGPGASAVERRFAELAAASAAAGAGAAGDGHRLVCVLDAVIDDHPDIAARVDELLVSVSADPTTLAWVIDRQHYELAHWEEISRRLDRRRFFDVADLVGVRQEDPEVFAATHARVLSMCRRGEVDGLRIDHPDGLADPGDYLSRLRSEIGDRWLVVEKILALDEQLPSSWPVDGTTGYERAAVIDRLFVDPEGEVPLTDLVRRMAPDDSVDPDVVMEQGKRDVLRLLFAPELRALTGLAARLIGQGSAADRTDPWDRPDRPDGQRVAAATGRADECDDPEVRSLVTELVVASPVYRTYVQRGRAAAPADRTVLDAIWRRADAEIAAGRHGVHITDSGVSAGLDGGGCRSVELRDVFDRADRSETEEAFVVRFQQLTAAITAKGVEDTAFYRLPRLAALCEVGADPARWSVDPHAFHGHQARWHSRWPTGMVAMSTHDSKRSADARARLLVLSETPRRWAEAVTRVSARLDDVLGREHRDRLLDLLLIQFAIALHPVSADRLAAAAIKAAREAKRATSWLHPDARHERQVDATARLLADDDECAAALSRLLDVVVPAGRTNAVAMAILACLAGGVPDLYQGSLGWQLALADPDNRAPVDHDDQRRLLADATAHGPRLWRATATPGDERGVTKAHVLRTCLAVRSEFGDAMCGAARPVEAIGAGAEHVVAWSLGPPLPVLRWSGEAHAAPAAVEPGVPSVVVVVGRLFTSLARHGGWRDTRVELPTGVWHDRLLGDDAEERSGTVGLDVLLGNRAGALLVRS